MNPHQVAAMSADLVQAWTTAWENAITAAVTGNGPLGLDNREIDGRLGPGGKFADKRAEYIDNCQKFVVSLLSPDQTADDAKTILRAIRKLFAPEGAKYPGQSNLPTAAYNSVLELISAKALWCNGQSWILPGGQLSDGKKPDFLVDSMSPDNVVADHLRVQAPKNLEQLVQGVVNGVTDKLASYPTRHVWVVADLTESPAIGGVDSDMLAGQCATAISQLSPQHLNRLGRVIIVVPGGIRVVHKES